MATRISGLAIMPRVSRNGIFYWPQELAKFDGLEVPLRWNHDQSEEGIIGKAKFKFDTEKNQVRYEAEITDPKFQKYVDEHNFQVSIGAEVSRESQICHPEGKGCFQAPVLTAPKELSIVETPGIPESTLTIIENSVQEPMGQYGDFAACVADQMSKGHDKDSAGAICGAIKKRTEADVTHEQLLFPNIQLPNEFAGFIDPVRLRAEILTSIRSKDPNMSPEESDRLSTEVITQMSKAFMGLITSNKPTCECKSMTEESPKVENVTEKVAEPVTEKVIETAVDTAKVVEEVAAKIQDSNEKTLKSVISELKEAWTPKSEVAETSSKKYVEENFTDEQAKAFLGRIFENGYGRLVIDKENWIRAHTLPVNGTHGDVQEAVSTSGTIPGVVTSSDVSIQIGSKTVKPIRQYGQYQSIPTGQNTARFYRISVPDAGAITESPTTDITAATHTLTAIDVTCSIRGWRQVVEKGELENFPAAFLNALRETARLEAIRDEHKLIVQDLGSLSNDFGGTTTAPYHISGSDGSAVSTTTLEDATGEFDEDGLSFAKRFLEQLGQDTSPGNLIAFISPRAFESLMTSSGLGSYTQIGFANVTRLGQLEQLYGIDIMVTNELKVANNSYRNLVCVKGKSWALASQREMEIELQKQIAGQYWDIVWSHRIGVNVLDPNTYVIVSSKQD